MACKYICDNCGVEEHANVNFKTPGYGDYKKPGHPLWFSRVVHGVREDACTRECADALNKRSKTPTGFTGF